MAQLYKSRSTVFASKDLAVLWGISNYDYLKTRIQYYIKQGYLHRICHGLYAKEKGSFDLLEVGNKLRTPSYVSFETVLSAEGIVFQYYASVFLASDFTRTIKNTAGEFVYRKLKDEILFCQKGLIFSGTYCVASKERAFLDAVYLYRNYHFDNLRPLDWKKVDQLAPLYQSKILLTRVKEYASDAHTR